MNGYSYPNLAALKKFNVLNGF